METTKKWREGNCSCLNWKGQSPRNNIGGHAQSPEGIAANIVKILQLMGNEMRDKMTC